HQRVKCGERTPWWHIHALPRADIVLPNLSHRSLRMTANESGALASNAFHAVAITHGAATRAMVVAASYTSLTQLSAEVEGHRLGGTALKLDPREAKRLLLPIGGLVRAPGIALEILSEIDARFRAHDIEGATAFADDAILRNLFGLALRDIRLLRDTCRLHRERRWRR